MEPIDSTPMSVGGAQGALARSMISGASPLTQVTPSSPGFDPQLQVDQTSPMPQKSPMDLIHAAAARRGMTVPGMPGHQPPQAPQMPQQAPQQQVAPSEAELIIKALTTRLQHHSKKEASVLSALLPQQNQGE